MKKRLAVLVLAFAMVLTMSASVFAANATGTAADNAYLVKYLKMAEGVSNPSIEFEFTFQATDGGPALGPAKITPATASESTTDGASVVGSVKLSSIAPKNKFTHAGVYHYTVTETASADGFTNGKRETTAADGTVTTEKLTFSQETYTLEVRVKNDPGNPGQLLDPEVTIEKPGTTGKIDATDSDPSVTQKTGEDPVDHGTEATIPGFSFTNTYEKTVKKPITPNPNDPTTGKYGAAGITKKVEGNYGDQTFEFPFSITLTKGVGVTGDSVTAKLITGTDVAGATNVTITYGTAKDFTLKHGQSLVFEELPAGVSYKVSENLQGCGVENEAKYTPSFNGTAGTMGASLVDQAVTVSDAEGAENDGHFINKVEDSDVTPTGIIINNLPYVLLIGIALGGIVLFSRKRRYE